MANSKPLEEVHDLIKFSGAKGGKLAKFVGDLLAISLFLEKREDEGKDVVSDYLVSFGGGMSLVALHHAVDSEDSFEKEGEQGNFVFLASRV